MYVRKKQREIADRYFIPVTEKTFPLIKTTKKYSDFNLT